MSTRLAALALEPSVGPIREVGTPWRWLAIPVTATVTGTGVRIPRGVLPGIAAALQGRPVRWCLREGLLDHPRKGADADDPAVKVGTVERAWATAWAVQAVIALDGDAARLHGALVRMRAAGQLRRLLGLSLHFQAEWQPGPALVVARITHIRAVDFVSTPADPDARVIRPLRADEFPARPDPDDIQHTPRSGGDG